MVADASGGLVDQAKRFDSLVRAECCLQLGESVTVCTRANIAVLQHLPATFGSSIRIVGKELTFDVALQLPGRKTVRRGKYPALECCDRLGVDPGEFVDNLAHARIVQLAGSKCGLGERKELAQGVTDLDVNFGCAPRTREHDRDLVARDPPRLVDITGHVEFRIESRLRQHGCTEHLLCGQHVLALRRCKEHVRQHEWIDDRTAVIYDCPHTARRSIIEHTFDTRPAHRQES